MPLEIQMLLEIGLGVFVIAVILLVSVIGDRDTTRSCSVLGRISNSPRYVMGREVDYQLQYYVSTNFSRTKKENPFF